MYIPIIVLAAVFLLIAIRRVGRIRLQIWQIMLFGAIAVLVTGQISPTDALKSINLDVMLFLFGMFTVGQAMEESGYLSKLAYRMFQRSNSIDSLILSILFGMGVASAFLMNDTIAIIGTPVVLLLAKKHGISPKLMLLTLAFAVTIGSAMSPIGNPQNVLIAINGGINNPFITFFRFLLLPTIINLFVAYFLLKLFYREQFHSKPLYHELDPIKDRLLAFLSKLSLIIIVALVAVKIGLGYLAPQVDFRLTYIALAAAVPILIFSPRRLRIIKNIDWHSLVFFAAMFVFMESVWQTGFFQSMITGLKINITSIPMILAISTLLSQFISNVPLVALYLPMLVQADASSKEMIALAAGSTIAGNMFILGAASNVIIIQNAEKRSGDTLTFFEFAKVGVPLTIANVLIYWVFLSRF
ncbi:MAG: anion transporter [Candidatus Hadarchaeum sp.]|uniref:anion transporter n=1 Tax=Candidatus Hadarchaeum sp. TaxID=2883567 RepID=UPI003D14C3F5